MKFLFIVFVSWFCSQRCSTTWAMYAIPFYVQFTGNASFLSICISVTLNLPFCLVSITYSSTHYGQNPLFSRFWIVSLYFSLYFEFRGLCLSLPPQHGQNIPLHITKILQWLQRFWPTLYLPALLGLFILNLAHTPLQIRTIKFLQ